MESPVMFSMWRSTGDGGSPSRTLQLGPPPGPPELELLDDGPLLGPLHESGQQGLPPPESPVLPPTFELELELLEPPELLELPDAVPDALPEFATDVCEEQP